MTDLKDEIIKSINDGKVKMKPKWRFILNGTLLFVGTVILVLTLVYLVSFLFFITGLPTTGEYLHEFPWLVTLLVIVFLVILEILVRQYEFTHRKPLLYTTIGILAFIIVAAFVVSSSSFHRGLFDSAHEHRLPFGNEFYHHYDRRPPGPLHPTY